MTRITVITKPDCHCCEEAKHLLRRLAPELGLEVEVIDLTTALGRELAVTSGMVFPPAVLIDGAPFSYGRLSERRLRRELARRRSPSMDSEPAFVDRLAGELREASAAGSARR
jgi:glutaredoxin